MDEIKIQESPEDDFPYCKICQRVTDSGCVESCDYFKELTEGDTDPWLIMQ